MGKFFIDLIVFVLSLAVLIVIHEFGHFITAKIFNVYVNEFSIGFGTPLFQKKKEGSETQFSIRAIPLGGYCSMVGENLPDFSEEELAQLSARDRELVELYKTIPENRRLDGIARWKRAVIMVAGVTLNFILAFFLFVGSYATQEYIYAWDNHVAVEVGSRAEKAGWKDDDVIENASFKVFFYEGDALKETKENSMECKEDTSNLYRIIVEASQKAPASSKDYIEFRFVTSESKEIDMKLNPEIDEVSHGFSWPKLGITFSGLTRHLNFGEVMSNSIRMTGEGSVLIVKSLGTLFTKEGIEQVGGIISMFELSTAVNSLGISYYFYLWGLISINLAVFNLLPFPGLDGWHFLVIIVESITRKELPKKFKNAMSTIGMLLLFGLMIVVTAKDIIGLF